jgi:putative SOS response-associated peptidase YedK
MCGRVTITDPSLERVAAALDARPTDEALSLHRARWNAAPGDRLCVALLRGGERLIVPGRWGMPLAARAGARRGAGSGLAHPGGRVLANRRVESGAGLRGASVRKRCALPVDGFYEWFGPANDRWPRWFHHREGGILRLAGIYGDTPDGPAFAILTVPAAEPVSQIHDRMPAILLPAELPAWLAGDEVQLLPAAPSPLSGRDVGQRVNGVAFDGPECIAPAVRHSGSGQLRLL